MIVLPNTAYCMNLDSRTDRWEQVCRDFKKLQNVMNIKLERVSAVPVPERPQKGVAQTVHKIINIAKQQNLEYVLILEDDLYIIDALKIKTCLNNAPEDWDILSGGVYHYVPLRTINANWVEMKDFCSLHFIILRKTVYDATLKLDGTAQHIDRALGNLVKSGKIKMYLMHPMPCQQRPGFSNIRKREVNDNRRQLPWIDSPEILKDTVISKPNTSQLSPKLTPINTTQIPPTNENLEPPTTSIDLLNLATITPIKDNDSVETGIEARRNNRMAELAQKNAATPESDSQTADANIQIQAQTNAGMPEPESQFTDSDIPIQVRRNNRMAELVQKNTVIPESKPRTSDADISIQARRNARMMELAQKNAATPEPESQTPDADISIQARRNARMMALAQKNTVIPESKPRTSDADISIQARRNARMMALAQKNTATPESKPRTSDADIPIQTRRNARMTQFKNPESKINNHPQKVEEKVQYIPPRQDILKDIAVTRAQAINNTRNKIISQTTELTGMEKIMEERKALLAMRKSKK